VLQKSEVLIRDHGSCSSLETGRERCLGLKWYRTEEGSWVWGLKQQT